MRGAAAAGRDRAVAAKEQDAPIAILDHLSADALSGPEDCNCLAVRQAARHITQFYDQFLAASGLRTTQFSILAKLRRLGPMTINALAADMVMDRTTLGRNILPLGVTV